MAVKSRIFSKRADAVFQTQSVLARWRGEYSFTNASLFAAVISALSCRRSAVRAVLSVRLDATLELLDGSRAIFQFAPKFDVFVANTLEGRVLLRQYVDSLLSASRDEPPRPIHPRARAPTRRLFVFSRSSKAALALKASPRSQTSASSERI